MDQFLQKIDKISKSYFEIYLLEQTEERQVNFSDIGRNIVVGDGRIYFKTYRSMRIFKHSHL